MTVAELIIKLQACPQNALVVCFDGNEENSLASDVRVQPVKELYWYSSENSLRKLCKNRLTIEIV